MGMSGGNPVTGEAKGMKSVQPQTRRPHNRRHLDERLRKFLHLKSVDELPDFCFACGEGFDNCECPKGEDD